MSNDFPNASDSDSFDHDSSGSVASDPVASNTGRDRVYAQLLASVGDFRFDDSVADVFEDMINRSVPGYGSILAMVPTLAQRFAKPHTHVYDLGCSLGAVSLAMRSVVPPTCVIHAIDQSPAMVHRLRKRLGESSAGADDDPSDESKQPNPKPKIEVHQGDILECEFENTSFAALNFTLQFIAIEKRISLLQSICDSMHPGAALLLSEKICLDDQAGQSLLSDLHHDFKRARGYSDLEIAQKRTSLENTLIPETVSTHNNRLRAAGFSTVVPWFECLGFVSLLAVKA